MNPVRPLQKFAFMNARIKYTVLGNRHVKLNITRFGGLTG